MKRYATTWLLILSIVIAESHSYVPREYATVRQNWIYSINRTQEIQWNVKDVSDEINAILYFVAMLFYRPNIVNKTTVITFIILCCIDLAMFFHNYKTLYYGSVYAWCFGIWVLCFYIQSRKK